MIINVENLTKDYKIIDRKDKFLGQLNQVLNRQYKIVNAVKSISFSIERGEIVGFIGPNGAGKSTIIKMLSGVLVPTSGSITVDGNIPWENRIKNAYIIGVVFGQRSQLWYDLPIEDTFWLFKRMYKIPDEIFKKNIECCYDILGLGNINKVPVRQLSLGQRMRAEIACSLLHDPKVLIYDEPTIGLDTLVKVNIRQFIKEINNSFGTTVILTSHDMIDIEQLAKRVIIINHGEIVFDNDFNKLRKLYGDESAISITIQGDFDNSKIDRFKYKVVQKEDTIDINFNNKSINAYEILEALRQDNVIKDFAIKQPSIEEIIVKLYSNFKIIE